MTTYSGWDGAEDERKGQEGVLIHVDVWQKPAQYCKAIILQLKKKHQKDLAGMAGGSVHRFSCGTLSSDP